MKRGSWIAAAAAAPLAAAAQPLIHVVVATAPIDGGISALVGVRGGFYKNHGLDVDLQSFSSGSAQVAALVGGSLNVAASNLLGVITAHLRGVPLQIIAPGGMYNSDQPAEMLVVRDDPAIRTAADLNGRTLASSALGDLDSIAALAWIDTHGGDSKTIHRVELPPSATTAALIAGRIDAAGLQEPRLSEALRTGKIRGLGKMYDAIGRRFLVSGAVAMADWVNANRDAAVRFYRAQLEANAYGNAHHDVTARWLADFAKADLDAILHTPRKVLAETLDLGMMQLVIDAAVKYKAIDRGFDARELVAPVILSAS